MRRHLKFKILVNYESQSAFAKNIGMREDILSRIVRGKRDPAEKERRQIINGLGINAGNHDFLFQDWPLAPRGGKNELNRT
jgi:hypothetical protein